MANKPIWDKAADVIQYIDDNVDALEAQGIDVKALRVDNETLVKIQRHKRYDKVYGMTHDDAMYCAISEVLGDGGAKSE